MTTKTLIVLSRPECVQCNATYRALDKKNLDYSVQDATTEENKVISARFNIKSAPAVLVMQGGEILEAWGGFRPDRIGAYAADPEAARSGAESLAA